MSKSNVQDWLSNHRPELRLALRMTVASVAAFAVATAMGLQQGYWSALTALIVTQSSVGGSLKVAIDRLLASICGAVYGAAITFVLPHHSLWSIDVALVAAVAPLALLAALNARFRVAPITSIIVLFSTTVSSTGPIGYATERVVEIALGCTIGLAVSSLLLPAHAYNLVLEATQQATALLAEQLRALGGAVCDPLPNLAGLPDKVRKALNKLETLADEVARERRNRLSDEPDPEPLYRTLRRLRQDIGAITRAFGEPLPAEVRHHLAGPWTQCAHAVADALAELGTLLVDRRAPSNLDPVTQAIAGFRAGVEAMRAAGATRNLSSDAVARVFGVVFTLDQLRLNLEDLSSRTTESARADQGLA